MALLVDGRDVRAFGSQGQQRTAALSMRLAELKVMRDELGERPGASTLDDVMSELDPGRRRRLLEHLKGVQTLVTCTDPDDLAGAEAGADRPRQRRENRTGAVKKRPPGRKIPGGRFGFKSVP